MMTLPLVITPMTTLTRRTVGIADPAEITPPASPNVLTKGDRPSANHPVYERHSACDYTQRVLTFQNQNIRGRQTTLCGHLHSVRALAGEQSPRVCTGAKGTATVHGGKRKMQTMQLSLVADQQETGKLRLPEVCIDISLVAHEASTRHEQGPMLTETRGTQTPQQRHHTPLIGHPRGQANQKNQQRFLKPRLHDRNIERRRHHLAWRPHRRLGTERTETPYKQPNSNMGRKYQPGRLEQSHLKPDGMAMLVHFVRKLVSSRLMHIQKLDHPHQQTPEPCAHTAAALHAEKNLICLHTPVRARFG